MKYYLAIDIGASSGRHIVGHKDASGEIVLDEVYRFNNWVQDKDGHLIWDIDALFLEVKRGIAEALKKYPRIESLSIDTWGVDYVLLDEDDKEIYPAYAYRDLRTEESIPEVHKILSKEKLYEITGVQFQKFNTIYQLFHDKMTGRLEKATSFLMIPEYLMWKLTGVKKKEITEGSTMGLYDGKTFRVSEEIVEKLGFPAFVKQEAHKPGTYLGPLKEDIQKEVGGNVDVVLCATHDTASAFEALSLDEESVFVSSGTWSILGITGPNVIATQEAMDAGYSNEYGPNYIRFLKNIMGMWIVNFLSKEIDLKVVDMVKIAQASKYKEIFDVNDGDFYAPTSMKEAILNYFAKRNMPMPGNNADIINSVYHSLASSYNEAIKELEKVTGRAYKTIYIVGGGAKNAYLNGLVAEYTQKKVVALPIEATSIGNIRVQMEANIPA